MDALRSVWHSQGLWIGNPCSCCARLGMPRTARQLNVTRSNRPGRRLLSQSWRKRQDFSTIKQSRIIYIGVRDIHSGWLLGKLGALVCIDFGSSAWARVESCEKNLTSIMSQHHPNPSLGAPRDLQPPGLSGCVLT